MRIDNEYEVETDEVIEISKDGITHYTFSISRTVPTDLVENLMISVDADGILTGKIVTYDLTEEEKQAIAFNNYVNLIDKMSVRVVENSFITDLFSRTGDCITLVWAGDSCPSHEQHTPEEIANGKCSIITNPNIYLVQIIVDGDCINGGGGSDGSGGTNNPTNPGTSPTNPGTGGGGGTPNPNPVITTPKLELRKNMIPCGQLKSFGDPAKMNLKPTIDALKILANDNLSNDVEYGVIIKKTYNDDDPVYTPSAIITGVPGGVEMNLKRFDIGDFHTHTRNGDAMFSFKDVRELANYYEGTEDSRKPEIFMGLVCKDKDGNLNVYVLKINDVIKLINAINAIWDNPKYVGKEDEDKFKDIHEAQAEKYRRSNGKLEKSFLKQFSNFGISLFKATDDTMTKWSELELDDTTDSGVKPVPCS